MQFLLDRHNGLGQDNEVPGLPPIVLGQSRCKT
jgi:hypothetical protein